MSDRHSNIVDDEPAAQPASADAPAAPTLEDAITPIQEPATETPKVEEGSTDIPDKYKGKSIADIIAMHQNAEQQIGKGSNELGELRSIVDDFIKVQSTPQSTNNTDNDEDEIDFLDDPKAAIAKAIETHPDVVGAKELQVSTTREKALNTIKSKYPDIGEMLTDTKFVDWVAKNPYRQKQLQSANNDYNVEAADDLFGTWKELNPAPIVDDAEKAALKADVAKNATDAQTGEVTAQAGESKKIYRRSDIVKLMQSDRPKYEALSDEIALAYREGRVR